MLVRTSGSSGGGSLSAIQSAFAALSAGQWGQVSVPTFTDDLVTVTPGETNSILEYGRRGYWDFIAGRGVYDGKSHDQDVGSDSRSRTVVISPSLVLSSLCVPGMNVDGVSGGHTGGDFTVNHVTGEYYGRQYFERIMMRLPFGSTTWTTTGIADMPGLQPMQSQQALEFHPDIGTSGALIACNEGEISILDLATDTWAPAPSGPSFPNIAGSSNNVSVWCTRNRCVYIGGGNESGATSKLWRIGSNGIPSARTDLPHECSHSGASGFLFPSVGNNWPLLVDHSTGVVRELNDSSGSGTYTSVGDFGDATGALANALATNNGWFVIPYDDPNPLYAGLLFFWMTDQNSTVTTAEIWKPPTSS